MMSFFDVWLLRDKWRNDGYDDWAEAKGVFGKLRVISVQWVYRCGSSWFQIMSSSPSEPESTAQLLAYIGWGFFILITIAACEHSDTRRAGQQSARHACRVHGVL